MALKAQWLVTAEIIPGQRIEELTKCWQYTSADYQLDTMETREAGPTIFEQYRQAATDYAMSLQDPSSINIVNFQFMWI